jgi:diguanylate cyclase (GGDEF)-like protein
MVSTLPPALIEARRLNAAAQFREAQSLASPLFLQARDAGQWDVMAESALLLCRASANLRDQAGALRWMHEAMLAATAAGRPDLVCASWIEAARLHARDEDGAKAQQAIDQVLALVPQLTSPEALEIAYSGLTLVYSELGLTSLAVSCGRHALAQAELNGEIERCAMARTNFLVIAGVACEQLLEPDPEAAQRLLQEMKPQLEQLRQEVPALASPLAAARLLRVEGAMAACEQRWPEACQAYEALTALHGVLPAALLCSAWIELGLAQRRLGLDEPSRHSGHAAEACNPVPDAPRRWVDLRRLAHVKDLLGQTQEAYALMRRSHDRRHHIVMTALESRAAALSARLDEQTLRIENEGLRRSNANLRATVADVARLAETDPLTGLFNRRGLEAAWAGLEGAEGHHRVLGLVDIDHFKRVNDRHSHLMGDMVLRQVAKLMNQELRSSDCIARYGGEEFAVVVVAADAAATQVFERLRRAVEAHDWSQLAPELALTVSVGAVRVGRGEAFEAAVGRADHLLYGAKAGGRNRVVIDLADGAGGAP